MSIHPILMADFVPNVLELYVSLERRPLTCQTMARVLRQLTSPEVLGPEASTADLTTRSIARWRLHYGQGKSPGTVVGLLSYIRAACSYAIEEGWLERAPNWKRLRPKMPHHKVGPHQSLTELRTLLDYLAARSKSGDWKDRRDEAAIATDIYTGLRRDELLFLRLEDIDLDHGIIRVVPLAERHLKTPESEQPVPIAPGLRPILEAWLPDSGSSWFLPGIRGKGAWHGGHCRSRPIAFLRRAAVACGIANASWNSLRISWATHAEGRWGLTDPQIQRVLRHTSIETGRIHYRASDLDNLRQIGGRISFT